MADTNELKSSIADAQRLLQYASVKGIEVSPELVGKIVGAQALLSQSPEDKESFEAQKEFWSALASLSILTRPATVDSVRHAAKSEPDVWAGRWAKLRAKIFRTDFALPSPLSTAEKAVNQARCLALAGLLVVAIFQSYYEVGQTTATKYVQAEVESKQESERAKELGKQREAVVRAKGSDSELQRIDQEISKSRSTFEVASEQTSRRLHWMNAMLFWNKGLPTVGDEPPSEAEKARYTLGILEGWLVLLRSFVLPIAWGFLGSALYVSRSLAEDIRAMAYASERAILHRSRYYMGMVAGFVAAKFFPTSVGVEFGEVAPFAVALLVGYSVEVLFSLLDRLIGAFSTK
ncbi:hypothetical protein [Acidovorax sp. SUPP2539]|uniref:hypothetical protein n=1 Tax=Acidovorax sp. SUPP2539 TaxID=2920878 RepID=UPI0023DE4074|nr:hypothetical protein [Acidovorax sp. SUPP2539]GKS90137.1 hypothetical protein AVTE2539_12250 [Acidovorax sp. SUPP2539]